jgi:hypothetical protein
MLASLLTILAAKYGHVKNPQQFEALRHEMQNVVIAFASVYTRHMAPAAIEAARAEFRALVKERGWEKWFESPVPTPRPPGPSLAQETP